MTSRRYNARGYDSSEGILQVYSLKAHVYKIPRYGKEGLVLNRKTWRDRSANANIRVSANRNDTVPDLHQCVSVIDPHFLSTFQFSIAINQSTVQEFGFSSLVQLPMPVHIPFTNLGEVSVPCTQAFFSASLRIKGMCPMRTYHLNRARLSTVLAVSDFVSITYSEHSFRQCKKARTYILTSFARAQRTGEEGERRIRTYLPTI
jgi:hypothetical protein